MAVDLELFCDMRLAAATDDVAHTVDYTQVADRVLPIAQPDRFHLLEALADRLAQAMLAEFSGSAVELWVRKLKPPVHGVRESTGARITRQAVSGAHGERPADWLTQHRHFLTPGHALDLACGHGRHTLYLAQEGFRVEAWDRDAAALEAVGGPGPTLGVSPLTA